MWSSYFVVENNSVFLSRFGNNFDIQVLDGLIRDIRSRTEFNEVGPQNYSRKGIHPNYLYPFVQSRLRNKLTSFAGEELGGNEIQEHV